PGEAVAWLNRVAYTVSVDEKRRERAEREGMRRLSAVRVVAADAAPEPTTASFTDEEARELLLALRDERVPAFAEARFPKREPTNLRVRIELAFVAAMDRDDYLRMLDSCRSCAGRTAQQV